LQVFIREGCLTSETVKNYNFGIRVILLEIESQIASNKSSPSSDKDCFFIKTSFGINHNAIILTIGVSIILQKLLD